MKRLYNLDYLRGIAAFGIMLYHYASWSYGNFSSDTFMGRLGIYGVSIFYVLSGLTLFHVYSDKMTLSFKDLSQFFRKRIFRIFPLLWLVTIVAIGMSRTKPDLVDVFFNLSGLFGFFRWDKYFSAGIWSIGNEIVFYSFFPIFIFFLRKKSKILILLLSSFLFCVYIFFAFYKLNANFSLAQQWRIYTNPLNQVFLFLGGVMIGYFLEKQPHLKTLSVVILIVSGVLLFSLYPVSGDTINIVTGINRIIFTICCFLICIGFYKMKFRFPGFIHKPFVLLGEMSYSVYLLHPIIFTLIGLITTNKLNVNSSIKIILAISSTFIFSYYVYNYFEKYFIRFGKEHRTQIA